MCFTIYSIASDHVQAKDSSGHRLARGLSQSDFMLRQRYIENSGYVHNFHACVLCGHLYTCMFAYMLCIHAAVYMCSYMLVYMCM